MAGSISDHFDQATAMEVDVDLGSEPSHRSLPGSSSEWLHQILQISTDGHADNLEEVAAYMQFAKTAIGSINSELAELRLTSTNLTPGIERYKRESVADTANRYLNLVLERCSAAVSEWTRSYSPELRENRPPWLVATLALHSDSRNILEPLLISLPRFSREELKTALLEIDQVVDLEDLLTRSLQHSQSVEPITYPVSLAEDFSKPYVGDAVKDLHKKIQQVVASLGNNKYYAPVLPILQSSGTGKSRAVTELSSYAPGITLCIRPTPSEGMAVSLPPQDKAIYNYLRSLKNDTRSHHCGMAALLLAVLKVISEVCEDYNTTSGQGIERPRNDSYRTGLVLHVSHAFADGIVQGYRSRSPSDEMELQDVTQQLPAQLNRKDYIDKIAMQAETIRRRLESQAPKCPDGDLLNVRNLAEALAIEIEAAMSKLVDLAPEGYFFLALDEFDQFKHLLPALRRLLSFPSIKVLCVFLLDTNNRIASVTRPSAQESSLRIQDGTKRLLLPHLVITQDSQLFERQSQRDYYDLITGKSKVDFKTLLSYLRRMGRPLWNDTSYRSENPKSSYAGVGLSFVLAKLLPKETRTAQDTNSILGLAASRLPLDFVGVQGSSNSAGFLQAQVALHLRCITGFELYGDVIYTATPSEPLMSAAAALYQRGGENGSCPQEFWGMAISQIRKTQLAGVLNVGENGEEFIRIIMSMAMDFTAYDRRPAGGITSSILNMINLGQWLKTMHGNLRLPPAYQSLVDESWLNFTHFARLDEQYTKRKKKQLPHRGLVQAFTRQCALLGTVNQMLKDGLIVAYWSGDRNNPPRLDQIFEHWRIFALPWQVRFRSTATNDFNHIKKTDLSGAVEKLKVDDLKRQPPAPMNIGIFYNISAINSEITLHPSQKHLTIYVGGHHVDQYPLIEKLKPSMAGDILVSLLGPAAHAAPRDKLKAGSEAWRNTYFSRGGKVYMLPKEPPT